MKNHHECVRRSRLIAAAGLAFALAACDQRSESGKAVESSAREIHAMTGGGSAPAPEEVRKKIYTQAAGTVQSVAGKGTDRENSAAALVAMTAHAGLADLPAQQHADLQIEVRNRIRMIDGSMSQWSLSNAVASAAEAFDPSPQIAQIAERRTAKREEAARQTERRDRLEKELADLRSQAAAKNEAAQAKLSAYSTRIQGTTRMSATEAEPIVIEANRIKFEGEKLRIEGSKLEAQAAVIQPVFDEIIAIIGQLNSQLANLDASEQDLNRKLAESKKEAAEARASASAAAQVIQSEVESLDAFRQNEVKQAFDAAVSAYSKALSSAKQAATGESAGTGKAAVGSAQVGLAEMHWSRAVAAKIYASMLESLATTSPALPGVDTINERLAKAREEHKQALADASAALEAAEQAFSGTRATGAVKERVDNLAKQLAGAKSLTQALQRDLPKGVPAELAVTVDAMLTLARDGKNAEILAMVHAPNEQARALLDAMSALMPKMAAAEAAFKAKFGGSLTEAISGAAGGMMGGLTASPLGVGPDAIKDLTASSFTYDVKDDRASLTGGGIPTPLSFINVNGEWKIDLPMLANPQIAMATPMIPRFGDALEQWARDIDAGTFADESAAMQGFQAAIMKAISGAGQPTGG